jgi:Tfp pilus assembly protein FimT
MLVTLAVLAVLVAMVQPAVLPLLEKHRLVGAVEDISGQLQLARSEALSRNDDIYFNTWVNGVDDTNWAFGFGLNADCDPADNDPVCELELVDATGINVTTHRVVAGRNNTHKDIKFTLVSGDGSIHFDPLRGLAELAEFQLESTGSGAYQINIKVSIVGTVEICSPSHTGGYSQC